MPRKGGKRKKSRTHVPVEGTGVVQKGGKVQPLAGASVKLPKSLVVRRGKIGRNVDILVDDLRQLMLPYTAAKLKERKSNAMKDYISAASPLGVTHILAVSQTEKGPTLRIGRLPSGPTLTFKLVRYALGHHVRQAQRKPVDPAPAYQTSPLVVLNNFDAGSEKPEGNRHLRIAALTFQAMFPTINVKTVKLSQCKRVLLVSYNAQDDTMELRHYVIRTSVHGASRTVKKIIKAKIPNLHKAEDISELILGGNQSSTAFGTGYATSDSEGEDDDALVQMPEARQQRQKHVSGAQSKIKLSEIGPRMTLQLLKIEDGAFSGEVQYHKFIKRSKEEVETLQQTHEEKRKLKEERRKQQEENVKRKQEAAELKERRKKERREAREAKRKLEAIGGGVIDQGDDYEAEDEEEPKVEDNVESKASKSKKVRFNSAT